MSKTIEISIRTERRLSIHRSVYLRKNRSWSDPEVNSTEKNNFSEHQADPSSDENNVNSSPMFSGTGFDLFGAIEPGRPDEGNAKTRTKWVRQYSPDQSQPQSDLLETDLQSLRKSSPVAESTTPCQSGNGIVLTQETFDRLLERLDRDREKAGVAYEQIRRKLVKFFECRGCLSPEDEADKTINVVAKRLSEGKEIWTKNTAGYFYGVARYVLHESRRESRKLMSIECLQEPENLGVTTMTDHLDISEQYLQEGSIEQLEELLHSLPSESRELIILYYRGGGRGKTDRKALASRFGIPVNALRSRVHRIREKLRQRLIPKNG